MQLLRLGWFIDSDQEKFDIWLWEIDGFSITFVHGKFASPKCRDWRIRVDAQIKNLGSEPLLRHTKAPVDGGLSLTPKSDKKPISLMTRCEWETERLAVAGRCLPALVFIAHLTQRPAG